MKKFIFTFIVLLFFSAYCESLKGGVVKEYIPDSFFGSWAVVSKLQNSTNPSMFNFESKDIWMLSGYANILVLENLESGARSELIVKDKSTDNKILKFEREKTVKESSTTKTIYRENIEFILSDNKFSGTDNYAVEKYKNGSQISKDNAKYKISGVRISGTNPK